MTEKKQNWLPWVVVAGLAYLLFNAKQQDAPKPIDPKPDVVTIEKAVKDAQANVRKEFATVFENAAAKVESGEIKSDAQLASYVTPLTKAAREQANKPFDVQFDLGLPRNDDGSFLGKEADVAKFLRRIAKAW